VGYATSPGKRPSSAGRDGIQVIARAATVLRTVASDGPIGLAELAREARLPKSSAHRIAKALEREDLLVAGVDGRLAIGPGLLRLAGRDAALETLVRPCLERLQAELAETVDLSVLDGASARFVDQLPAPRRLRAVSAVGDSFPLHCTANGKALLAAMPADEAMALLPRRLEALTPQTIIRRADLREELDRVRAEGVAFDREEHTEGIGAVAACVFDGHRAAGAISVPAPTARFESSAARYARRVRAAAAAASQRLAAASGATRRPASTGR